MAREEGFAIASVASDYFDDDKVRALVRRLSPDAGSIAYALSLHEATFLASWADGRRKTVDEAAPLWLPVRDDLVSELVAVKMLDRSRRIPSRSWDRWFGPALERRQARIEAGRRGGTAKAQQSSSNATAGLYLSDRLSDRLSVPSDGPTASPRTRSRKGGAPRGSGPTTLAEAMAATPFGQELAKRNGGTHE